MSTATVPLPLTGRQQATLDAVVANLRTHGRAPTVREVADATGVTKNAAWGHLKALARKGYIELPRDLSSRSVRLANRKPCPCCDGLGTVPMDHTEG